MLKKIISMFVLVCFFSVNLNLCIYAEAKNNIFELSSSFGKITESYTGDKNILVYLIQDAHANQEAQKNIYNVIKCLKQYHKNNLQFIGLEGSTGKLNFNLFLDIKNKKIKNKILDNMLKNGYLTGSELYFIKNPKDISLYGIENDSLYEKDFECLYKSLFYRKKINEEINYLEKIIVFGKYVLYPENLRYFEIKKEEYRQNKISFREFLNYVVMFIEKNQLNNINIRKNIKYYFELEKLQSNNLKYNLYKKNIYEEMLFVELDDLVYDIEKYFINGTGDSEKVLYCDKYLQIFKKFVNNKISSQEFNLWQINKNKFYKNINELSLMLAGKNKFEYNKNLDSIMTSFYVLAEKRNEFIVNNAIFCLMRDSEKMKKTNLGRLDSCPVMRQGKNFRRNDNSFPLNKGGKQNVGILVAGGYHKQGITNILRARGISYKVITPNITKFYNENVYTKRLIEQAQYSKIKIDIQPICENYKSFRVINTLGLRSLADPKLLEEQVKVLQSLLKDCYTQEQINKFFLNECKYNSGLILVLKRIGIIPSAPEQQGHVRQKTSMFEDLNKKTEHEKNKFQTMRRSAVMQSAPKSPPKSPVTFSASLNPSVLISVTPSDSKIPTVSPNKFAVQNSVVKQDNPDHGQITPKHLPPPNYRREGRVREKSADDILPDLRINTLQSQPVNSTNNTPKLSTMLNLSSDHTDLIVIPSQNAPTTTTSITQIQPLLQTTITTQSLSNTSNNSSSASASQVMTQSQKSSSSSSASSSSSSANSIPVPSSPKKSLPILSHVRINSKDYMDAISPKQGKVFAQTQQLNKEAEEKEKEKQKQKIRSQRKLVRKKSQRALKETRFKNDIVSNPFNYNNYFDLAEFYKSENKFEEAVEMYVKGFVLNPTEDINKKYYNNYIQCKEALLNSGKFREQQKLKFEFYNNISIEIEKLFHSSNQTQTMKNIIELFKQLDYLFSRIIVEIIIRNNNWYNSPSMSINRSGLYIQDIVNSSENINKKLDQSPVNSLERIVLNIILYNSTKDAKYIKDAQESLKMALAGHMDFLYNTKQLENKSFDITHEVCSIFYLFKLCGIKYIEQKMMLELTSSINDVLSKRSIEQRKDINKYLLTLSVMYNFNNQICLNMLGQTSESAFYDLNNKSYTLFKKEISINDMIKYVLSKHKNTKKNINKLWTYLKKIKYFINNWFSLNLNTWDIFDRIIDTDNMILNTKEIISVDFDYDVFYKSKELFVQKYKKYFPEKSSISGGESGSLTGRLIKFSNGLVKLIVYKNDNYALRGQKQIYYAKILSPLLEEEVINKIHLSKWFDINIKVYDLLKTTLGSDKDLLVKTTEFISESYARFLAGLDRKNNEELFELKSLEYICKAV
jgi:hypothetical protein